MSEDQNSSTDKPIKKLPPNSVKLMRAGELALVRCTNPKLKGLYRRYESLFEMFANLDKDTRLLNYRILAALIFTSHAKKTVDREERRKLFDYKNEMYFRVANDRDLRRKVGFMYLASNNFRVLKFCEECEKKNKEQEVPPHKWAYCKSCDVDRKFYNVLSMHHRFEDGHSTIFLSNDLIPKIEGLKVKKRGNLADTKEEARYGKYHYNVRNLDVFELAPVLEWYEQLKK